MPLKKKSERKENKTFEKKFFFKGFFLVLKGFLALLAVISWGEADLLFKSLCKVGVVVIAHLEGDLVNGCIALR